MKIFGIGMAKTGLCSLSAAMRFLGFRCMHGILNASAYPEIINDVDFVCDMPIVTRYKELDKMFPGSKFILTLRNGKQWSRSAGKWMSEGVGDILGDYRIEQFGLKRYGDGPHVFKDRYIDHTIEVITYFRDRMSDLLILNICNGDGWESLSPFVGARIPLVDFPHENKQEYK